MPCHILHSTHITDLFLRSMKRHVFPWESLQVTVLYTTTASTFEKGYNLTRQYHHDVQFIKEVGGAFKELLESTVAAQKSDLVALFVDDILFISDFYLDGPELDIFAENSPVLTLSLRLHPGVTYFYATNTRNISVPPLHQVSTAASVWEWGHPRVRGDWTFPLSLDGHIFRRQELSAWLHRIEYSNPNTLEFNMVPLANDMLRQEDVKQPFMMCFDAPVLVNVPINRVQQVHANRFNSKDVHSSRELNSRFLQQERLEIPTFAEVQTLLSSVHIDIGLSFEPLFAGESYVPWDLVYVGMHSRAGEDLFATEDNAECVDPIFVQGHEWFWSVRDSLQYRCLQSLDFSRYVLMLALLGDDEHSLRGFLDLREDLHLAAMPPLQARFDLGMMKLVLTQGTHRAAILLDRNLVGLPLSKVKITYSAEAIKFVEHCLAQVFAVPSHGKEIEFYHVPYHSFSLGQNVIIRGHRNTSHFVDVLSRYVSFDRARVLEIGGGGGGGNLMALAARFNLTRGVGVLHSPVQVEAARNISHTLLPWARLHFLEHSSLSSFSSSPLLAPLFSSSADAHFSSDADANANDDDDDDADAVIYDVLIINYVDFEEEDWSRVCEVYLPLARVVVLDSFVDDTVRSGLEAISKCDHAPHITVKSVELLAADKSILQQTHLHLIHNHAK
jgi:hypothetical protein